MVSGFSESIPPAIINFVLLLNFLTFLYVSIACSTPFDFSNLPTYSNFKCLESFLLLTIELGGVIPLPKQKYHDQFTIVETDSKLPVNLLEHQIQTKI